MKALFVLILCLLPPTTAFCTGTTTQAIFWLAILAPIVVGFVIGLFVPFIGNAYGHYIGAFIADNNTRSNTLIPVGVLAFVVCIIGGFGPPLLQGSPEITKIAGYVGNYDNPSAKNALLEVLGNGTVKLKKEIKPEAKAKAEEEEPKQYASWYNWLVALLVLVCGFLYWPIARRDEVMHAWQEVSERRAQRKRDEDQKKASDALTATSTAPATTPAVAVSTAPAKASPSSWFGKWTFGKDFASDFGADLLMEFLKQLSRLRNLRA